MTTKQRSFHTLLLAVSIEPQEIGRRIAAARERKGWTQMVFAQEANVSLSSVQRWERGDLPPVRELIRIAGVLGIEPEQLVEVAPTAEDQVAALRSEVAGGRAEIREVREMLQELLRRAS